MIHTFMFDRPIRSSSRESLSQSNSQNERAIREGAIAAETDEGWCLLLGVKTGKNAYNVWNIFQTIF